MGEPLRVGVVGCGVISEQYLTTLVGAAEVDVVAVADVDRTRADVTAQRRGLRAVDLPELYALDGLEWVLDLTTPAAHEQVALDAIAHGRSVHNEKPLCSTVAAARRVLEAAGAAGLAVGGAPDTVLGTGVQTARAAVEAGAIGRPVAATATMACGGHEAWHPQPDFYYAPGGGPLLDMGPYYLTTLVHLLGPVTAVQGVATRPRTHRTIGQGPRAGEQVPVDVATHVTALVEHASGAVTTLLMSFDAPATTASPIEVHGEEGSLLVPDPNRFDGDVRVHARGDEWRTLPVSAGYAGAGRGVGLVDAARSADRRTTRASADVALHVLDTMETVLRAADARTRLEVATTCDVPPLVPLTDLTPLSDPNPGRPDMPTPTPHARAAS
ncbi:oxidoreductase domain protein [Cellulomonas flavigena DSM 20109]|uniref:Oxidoreductase domain protein n=1 Tax=Cellulomonas flavigena (strain ATCC 482 / DSM 20109 / BCRC 11376 / JCM 18109 / NBRC 3775 / NCIMB 8073 / NRS 134) TaxID=446466 RepID=D5UBJ8_CELFN|nr:Gfo/Idh/MocA family oxidoreductase [Cellulomonas flavigena]ADG74093.1 oxidoreductase domain protein [Cellulomonas flavigena DSM 20109]